MEVAAAMAAPSYLSPKMAHEGHKSGNSSIICMNVASHQVLLDSSGVAASFRRDFAGEAVFVLHP